ncbi:Alpha/beta hydrolase family protein [Rhizobium sp. NFR07]|uniref:alpha/beta hydrolase family protein n=1 Tax=Rhizobium sp. NFR07 TaxID=1566262 RepID=UPI0008ED8CB3|nr:prolyl oligopeptidase family serine peptidase [Rhizobium sp. NFR07]SFB04652.1 Alpha/beta hydrolase family protein [Rhizobium sp. NFR07]
MLGRRSFLAGIAALLAPSGGRAAPYAIPPVPPLSREDYGRARLNFTTHLIRSGPAPEASQPLGTPPGAQRVTYRGGPDGSIDLVAWLSQYEPSRTLRPAVLFLHGGNATGDGHWELMKPYRDAGFVVLLPSFRGENGQEGIFSGFYDETGDALAAAAFLENLPGIDRNRLFLAGHSNGGTMALLCAMARPFRAAVPISASVNAWRFFDRFRDDLRFDTSNPQEFVMRSSVCFAPSLKCPTLLLRGAQENPYDQDHLLLIERARSAGLAIDKALLPGTHNGVVPGAVDESIRFFNRFG